MKIQPLSISHVIDNRLNCDLGDTEKIVSFLIKSH